MQPAQQVLQVGDCRGIDTGVNAFTGAGGARPSQEATRYVYWQHGAAWASPPGGACLPLLRVAHHCAAPNAAFSQ